MGWNGVGWDEMGWGGWSKLNQKIQKHPLGLMGWDGMDGVGWGLDGDQKGPLIFFILRYIKNYTHIYLYRDI